MQTIAAKRLTCADTAKLVRKHLRAEFPGVKFRVRSSTYSGGASIHVRWTDGPTEAQVRSTTHHFAGATFDGMTDMKEYKDDVLMADPATGELSLVDMGADYVLCHRDISGEWYAEIAAEIAAISGMPCDLSRRTWTKAGPSGHNGAGWDTLYPVCVVDGKFYSYAGTEYGTTLAHQYAATQAR